MKGARMFGLPVMSLLRKLLERRQRVLTSAMLQLGRPRRLNVFQNAYTNEYIRLSSLDLIADEIKVRQVPGAVAELGVYKGHFAAAINTVFPDRTLYLFDTFTGFSTEEELRDQANHGLAYQRDFSDTSPEGVLRRMPHADRCVVRQGLFPETAQSLESETFCFASIDTDLYDPIVSGLEFFYERLNPGGYLFVHDYNNSLYPGAKKAVVDFSTRRRVAYVPLTDMYGTAIFAKP
jgi:O-methyltransferase